MKELLMQTYLIALPIFLGYVVWKLQKNDEKRSKDEEKREQETKGIAERQKALEEGVRGLLHDKIMKRCEQLLTIGEVTFDDLKELDYLYKPYVALGGNGTAKEAYDKVHALHWTKEHEKKIEEMD